MRFYGRSCMQICICTAEKYPDKQQIKSMRPSPFFISKSTCAFSDSIERCTMMMCLGSLRSVVIYRITFYGCYLILGILVQSNVEGMS